MTANGGGLFDTVVKLVNLGFAGVGVVVLLLVFIILIRDKPATPAENRLRERFLAWGMSFAVFCGVLAFAGPLLAPRPVIAKPPKITMAFSPSFTEQKLTLPKIKVSDGRAVLPDVPFEMNDDGGITVVVDTALNEVAALKQAAEQLQAAATTAQDQADKAVAALAQSQAQGGTPAPPVVAAQTQAQDASVKTKEATTAMIQAIRTGQFDKLKASGDDLNRKTVASIAARNRVIRQVRN